MNYYGYHFPAKNHDDDNGLESEEFQVLFFLLHRILLHIFFCSYVGSHLRKKFGLELGRITGLDPAEPHFEWAHEITRLDASDAYFVDIIHTDGNPLMKMGLGMYQACGHLDFYPNGGKVMAGCDGTFANSLAQENGSLPYTLRR